MSEVALIAAGLGRKKLRTALLVFSVFITFTVFAVLAAFQSGVSGSVGGSGGERLMVSNRLSFTQNLPLSYVDQVRKIDGVRDVSYSQYVGGYFQEPRNYLLAFAVDPHSWLRIHPEFVAPVEQLQAFAEGRDSVMIGRAVADRFGWSIGDQVPISSHMWERDDTGAAWPVIVRAIYEGDTAGTSTEQIFMHYDYLARGRTEAHGEIGYIHISPASEEETDRLVADIDRMFANSAAETRTSSEQAFYAAFVEQQGSIGLMVVLVASAGLVTSLLIVGNAMMQSVRERTREIAIMRTIGFTSRRLARAVLGETFAITLTGGLFGLAAAGWIIGYLRTFGMFFSNMALTPLVALSAVVLMVVLAVLTGVSPAWNASRVSVATVFRRR